MFNYAIAIFIFKWNKSNIDFQSITHNIQIAFMSNSISQS